jgi:hypothetical protein
MVIRVQLQPAIPGIKPDLLSDAKTSGAPAGDCRPPTRGPTTALPSGSHCGDHRELCFTSIPRWLRQYVARDARAPVGAATNGPYERQLLAAIIVALSDPRISPAPERGRQGSPRQYPSSRGSLFIRAPAFWVGREEVSDLCEDWMRHADRILADEQIVATGARIIIYQAEPHSVSP